MIMNNVCKLPYGRSYTTQLQRDLLHFVVSLSFKICYRVVDSECFV